MPLSVFNYLETLFFGFENFIAILIDICLDVQIFSTFIATGIYAIESLVVAGCGQSNF